MYGLGDGVEQDYVQAYKWANLAASRASRNAQRAFAAMLRDRYAEKMTSQQIAEGQRLTREWKPKPAGAMN
jgi:TPR repeat protein